MKFLGSIISISKVQNYNLETNKEVFTIRDLILKLTKVFGNQFKGYILDEKDKKINPYIIILINDKSIDLLDRLSTILKDNDNIVFLSSIHGG